jgi:hypothetical protein
MIGIASRLAHMNGWDEAQVPALRTGAPTSDAKIDVLTRRVVNGTDFRVMNDPGRVEPGGASQQRRDQTSQLKGLPARVKASTTCGPVCTEDLSSDVVAVRSVESRQAGSSDGATAQARQSHRSPAFNANDVPYCGSYAASSSKLPAKNGRAHVYRLLLPKRSCAE